MSAWIVVQIILNIGFIAAGLVFWARLNRPQKDDPRLSRGLQLLQSKIAILEDLSDRTDLQVKQLSGLLDQKGREVQEYVASAQNEISKIEMSIEKSMDVSKIIQDKIPHKEIVERQNTVKYVQAARMAHQGMSVEEIAAKIDIPRSELEFIVKVNKNKLMFSEEHLPQWIQESQNVQAAPQMRPRDFSSVFEAPKVSSVQENDKKIQDQFRQAIEEMKAKELAKENFQAMADNVTESVSEGIQTAKNKIAGLAEKILNPYFLDKVEDHEDEIKMREELEAEIAQREVVSDQIVTKNIITSESEDAKAIKPFVFKNLDKDL